MTALVFRSFNGTGYIAFIDCLLDKRPFCHPRPASLSKSARAA